MLLRFIFNTKMLEIGFGINVVFFHYEKSLLSKYNHDKEYKSDHLIFKSLIILNASECDV